MKVNLLMISFIIILSICAASCKKDSDYRDGYVGNYSFVVNEHIFNLKDSTYRDTIVNYSGTITKGTNPDELTIAYLPDFWISAILTQNGDIEQPTSAGLGRSYGGKFETMTKISFSYYIEGSTQNVLGNKR
jgi:hypothetical protein